MPNQRAVPCTAHIFPSASISLETCGLNKFRAAYFVMLNIQYLKFLDKLGKIFELNKFCLFNFALCFIIIEQKIVIPRPPETVRAR